MDFSPAAVVSLSELQSANASSRLPARPTCLRIICLVRDSMPSDLPFMILLDQSGAAANQSQLFSPSSDLAPFVDHFWVQHALSGAIGSSWRVIPEANANLIFVVSRTDAGCIRNRCCLVGPRSRFADITMAQRILTCGARLRAGALPLLTRFPARDFTDRSVRVDEVFGARGRLLTEQLSESNSPIAAIRIISDFLSHQWRHKNQIVPLPVGHYARVEGMALHAGLPIRTLHSRLIQHIGLPPKLVLRIERLHRALVGSQGRAVSWAQVALNCGFADQAHMIREFRALLGEPPTVWSRRSRLPIRSRQ